MLLTALEFLCLQTIDVSVYEVIVVDNNSTDNTNIVVDEFCRESNQGLSHARNRGWREARGQYMWLLWMMTRRPVAIGSKMGFRCFCEIEISGSSFKQINFWGGFDITDGWYLRH
jgi:glycosyltransferase involved in cell wall biosynthesis